MPTLKPFLPLEAQADKILSRGCIGAKSEIIEKLKFVNYYRLSGYLYPYRKVDSKSGKRLEDFLPGTTFEAVWNTYRFDRHLKLILLDAIERIEIALRTRVAFIWSESTKNANGEYCSNPQNDSSLLDDRNYRDLLEYIQKSYDSSQTACAIHYKEKGFKDVNDLPIWVFVEFLTFGNLQFLISKWLPVRVKKTLAQSFGIKKDRKLVSIISLIREIRNTCAHHARVWNNSWTYKKQKKSISPIPVAPEMCDEIGPASAIVKDRWKTGYFLLLCDFLLRTIAPGSLWKTRLRTLCEEIKTDPLQMGFRTREDFEAWLKA